MATSAVASDAEASSDSLQSINAEDTSDEETWLVSGFGYLC